MSTVQYNLVERAGGSNITVVVDGDMKVADDTHPLWSEIKAKAVALDESVIDLFDASTRVAERFERLSERVTVAHSRIYVDGDEIEDAFADQIVRFMDEDLDDWKPLVKFLEKVYTNTEKHTRENLSRWLNATGGFTITEEGNIIGYKGLTAEFGSIHRGPAIVDGKAVNGSVPNQPGSVIEIARSAVEHNPAVGCASGLHVGTWEYASGFGRGVVVEVEVNPRDVVSVPTDCNGQKMRVARYTVVRALDEAHNEAVIPSGLAVAEDFETPEEAEAYVEGYEDGYTDGDAGESWGSNSKVPVV